MVNGVFHQWLQQQRRHADPADRLVGLDAEVQTIAHAQLHQAQVVPDHVELVGQRNGVGAHQRQAGAQVLGEGVEQLAGGRRVAVDQAAHIGQGVEQVMRFDLCLQQLQLGLLGLQLELALAPFLPGPHAPDDAGKQRDSAERSPGALHVPVHPLATGQAAQQFAGQEQADQHAGDGRGGKEGAHPGRRFAIGPVDEALRRPALDGAVQRVDDGAHQQGRDQEGRHGARPAQAREVLAPQQPAQQQETAAPGQRHQQGERPQRPGRFLALFFQLEEVLAGGAQGVEESHGAAV